MHIHTPFGTHIPRLATQTTACMNIHILFYIQIRQIATADVLGNRRAEYAKFAGIRKALNTYETAVWTDMEGVTPFAPRVEGDRQVMYIRV